jgi:hypothetical protein
MLSVSNGRFLGGKKSTPSINLQADQSISSILEFCHFALMTRLCVRLSAPTFRLWLSGAHTIVQRGNDKWAVDERANKMMHRRSREYSVYLYFICSPSLPNFIPCWIFITWQRERCVSNAFRPPLIIGIQRNVRESAQNGHGELLCGLCSHQFSRMAPFPRKWMNCSANSEQLCSRVILSFTSKWNYIHFANCLVYVL